MTIHDNSVIPPEEKGSLLNCNPDNSASGEARPSFNFKDPREKDFACFDVRDDSFIEVRDCLMKSVLDDELLYIELEKFLAYALKDSRASTGETDYIK
jgi:hypothetical protein